MTLDLSHLMEVAEGVVAAKSGTAWRVDPKDGECVHATLIHNGRSAYRPVCYEVLPTDAAFIAAWNPEVCLALLARLQAAEEALRLIGKHAAESTDEPWMVLTTIRDAAASYFEALRPSGLLALDLRFGRF